MKSILLALFTLSVIAKSAAAIPTEDLTPSNLPIDCEIQKTKVQDDRLWVSAEVTNKGNGTYKLIEIVLTARDGSGKVVSKEFCYPTPMELAPGESGDLIGFPMSLDGGKPTLLQYKLSGRKK